MHNGVSRGGVVDLRAVGRPFDDERSEKEILKSAAQRDGGEVRRVTLLLVDRYLLWEAHIQQHEQEQEHEKAAMQTAYLTRC